MYFLVIDECKDRASHEQLSLCVRYSVGAVAKERYVGLVRLAQDFSAEAIANKILPFITALNSEAVFVGLTTDGVSVLFGHASGVATRLREVYSWIVNLRCTAQRLNLIIGKIATCMLPSTLKAAPFLHQCTQDILYL